MAVTISDIAKLAGVSIATVSRVVNKKTEGVSADKRREILTIIEKYDYEPSGLARSLVTRQSRTIGFVIPDIENPFFPSMARGVEDVAMKNGYSVFLCNSDGRRKKEAEYLKILHEKRVDGLIFTSWGTIEENLSRQLGRRSVPVVLVDEPIFFENAYGVFSNDAAGGYIATTHLLSLGHRKLACIAGPENSASTRYRVEGYRKALSEAQISVDKDTIIFGDYNFAHGLRAMDSLFNHDMPSAVFAANDLIAYGVYRSLQNHGLAIPYDVSVVGFDNLFTSQFLNPGLTTVSQDAYGLGVKASEMLFQLLNNQPVEQKITWFEPKLIERNSTCTTI